MSPAAPRNELELSWGVKQRLAFIESRLFWDGGVKRPDLIAEFGISVTQASQDLALYQVQAPANLRYDGARKCYVMMTSFKPRYIELDGDAYLRRQPRVEVGAAAGIFGERLPIPSRPIDPHALRLIVAAARNRQSVEIRYASSSDDQPGLSWRRVSPHAFAHDGLRWHARAYCHRTERFMDFIVSRALAARDPGPQGKPAGDDTAWNTNFVVVLCPNPLLQPGLQQIAADDFGMKNGQVSISVRRAMLYYFGKRLRLDLAQSAQDPRAVPVIARNRAELEAALAKAGPPENEPVTVPLRRRR